MNLRYDKETDSLYINLSDRPSIDSKEVAPGVVLDFGRDGAVVGIDIEYASRVVDLEKLDVGSLPYGAQPVPFA